MEGEKIEKDELAAMIKNGFDSMGQEMSRRFDIVEKDITELKNGYGELKQSQNELKQSQNELSSRMETEFSSVRSEIGSVRNDLGALREEMHEGFMKTNDKVDLLAVKLTDNKAISTKDFKEVAAINPARP